MPLGRDAKVRFIDLGAWTNREYTTPPDKINPDDPSSFQWPPSEATRIKYFGAGHVVGYTSAGPGAGKRVGGHGVGL